MNRDEDQDWGRRFIDLDVFLLEEKTKAHGEWECPLFTETPFGFERV